MADAYVSIVTYGLPTPLDGAYCNAAVSSTASLLAH